MINTFTRNIGEGIQLVITTGIMASNRRRHARLIIACEVDGYMVSDPICKMELPAPKLLPQATRMAIVKINVDTSVVDKNITGFLFYVSNNDEGVELDRWKDLYPDYYYKNKVSTESGWSDSGTSPYNKTISIWVPCVAEPQNHSYIDDIGHMPLLLRSYITPRFISQGQRSQGSTIVLDDGDGRIRFSLLAPGPVHFDEKFPFASDDEQGRLLSVTLESRGRMLGHVVMDEQVHVFTPTELTIIDLHQHYTRMENVDCCSARSIVMTPYGIVWAGYEAIYLKPVGRGTVRILNPLWVNLYNGDLKDNSNNEIITKTHREAIKGTYDPYYQSVWFVINDKLYIYSFESQRWRVRDISVAGINDFFVDVTGKLAVVKDTEILLYPNTVGPARYLEHAAWTGQSGEGGIPTKISINMGNLYDLTENYILYDVLIDFKGYSSIQGESFNVDFYVNNSTTAIATKKFPINTRPVRRRLPRFGRIERLRMDIYLPETNLATFGEFTISQINFGIVKTEREGTR